MRILNVMIGLFLVLLIVPAVLASTEFGNVIDGGGKLLITDMDVKVGSKTDKNLDFGDTIKDEAKPGDVVKFIIQGENNFTDAEELKIEDITVTVTIEGIDDGDDLEEEGELKDLSDGKNDDVTIEFTIPLEVEEDNYNVLIVVEGEDENGTTHEVQYELELEVQKEDDEVRFLMNTLTPSEIKCSRNVQLSTAVINTGADEQDTVVLEITNSELGISLRETFDLSNDAFDDDSKFRKTFTILIPEDVQAGIYTIPSKVTFKDGSDTVTETAELLVTQCELLVEEPTVECKTDNDCKRTEICDNGECVEEEEENVVVIQPPVDTTPTDVITAGTVTTPTLPATEEKSLFESSGFMIALIAGEILLVLIAILLVVAVVKKKSQ